VADALHRIHAGHDGRIACASGADRFKVELMLGKLGLLRYFEQRIFSGHEMPRSKPHPDVYLAAATALAALPTRCAVVEDTLTGVRAGVAAGATVFAYVPPSSRHVDAGVLRQAGAYHVFDDMALLPGLLGL
jgi:beta-phosphoglucomutase-like phosphatase (HAD superfamily)